MSLTEEQKTAKNFHEFYSMIRPYLNGSFPTPIVNKFSKGDLYSTEEKIIGQWIDGKPIYQKSFNLLASSVNLDDNNDIGLSSANIEKIVYTNGIVKMSDGATTPLPFINPAGLTRTSSFFFTNNFQLGLRFGSDQRSVNYILLTIQYTKTTDSPISIGDGNDYSTDEQVVGTWIDGKPVYQKTISCGALPNATTKNIASNLQNEKVVECIGYAFNPTNKVTFSLPYGETNGAINCYYNGTTHNIIIKTEGDRSAYSECYMVLKYTKTTD